MDFLRKTNGFFRQGFVLALDLVVSMICSLLAVLMLRWLTGPIFDLQRYVITWLLMALVGSVTGFMVMGSYKVVIRHSTFRNIGEICVAVIMKEIVLLACILADLYQIRNMNGIQSMLVMLVLDFLLTTFSTVMLRVFVIILLENRKDTVKINIDRLSVVVYGTSNKSIAMVTRLEESPHYNVVGFISKDKDMSGKIISNKKVYIAENEEDFRNLCITLGGIECLLFALQDDADEQKDGVAQWCINAGIHILMAPKVTEVYYNGIIENTSHEYSNDINFIADGMTGFERNVKRIVDCCVAAVLIVFFSPLMLICYIAIKIEDHGPALYKQERIGRFGRPFNIMKFRSMKVDAEMAGPALYSGDNDPRLTKVGKFFRQHHLDELPQLFNVFAGDMAFIGYRPERQFYINQIMEVDPRYYYLYQIRPGVTSYATLYNGYTDTLEKMVRRLQYDLYYLKHRSWWFDIKILWLTFINIVFGKKF